MATDAEAEPLVRLAHHDPVGRDEIIAQQFIARVHGDDNPDATDRWFNNITDGDPWTQRRILYLVAAAASVDRTWRESTAWAWGAQHLVDTPYLQACRRRALNEALPARRGAA